MGISAAKRYSLRRSNSKWLNWSPERRKSELDEETISRIWKTKWRTPAIGNKTSSHKYSHYISKSVRNAWTISQSVRGNVSEISARFWVNYYFLFIIIINYSMFYYCGRCSVYPEYTIWCMPAMTTQYCWWPTAENDMVLSQKKQNEFRIQEREQKFRKNTSKSWKSNWQITKKK